MYYLIVSKAESLAILTALVTAPSNCHVNIFTDSQNLITTYHKVSLLTKYRRKLKIKNISIWQAIINTVKELSLNIYFQKVKGHSNNEKNDKADELAKKGAKSSPYLVDVNRRFLPESLCYVTWNNNFIIN